MGTLHLVTRINGIRNRNRPTHIPLYEGYRGISSIPLNANIGIYHIPLNANIALARDAFSVLSVTESDYN